MVNRETYNQYSLDFEELMNGIGELLGALAQATGRLEYNGTKLRTQADVLAAELTGSSDEGGLAVFRDLEALLESTTRFARRWESDQSATEVVSIVECISSKLRRMRETVTSAPPGFMEAIVFKIRVAEFLGSWPFMIGIFFVVLLIAQSPFIDGPHWGVILLAAGIAIAVPALLVYIRSRRLLSYVKSQA